MNKKRRVRAHLGEYVERLQAVREAVVGLVEVGVHAVQLVHVVHVGASVRQVGVDV